MRILQAHNRHASRGGADAVMDQERDLLQSAGHQVEQLTTSAVSTAGWRQGAAAVWNRETTRQLAEAVDRFGPDVLHVHTPFPLMSPVVFRAARRLGVPTVATQHSFRYTCVAATLYRDGELCHECVGRRVKTPAVRHRCYHDSLAGSGALATSLTVHRAVGTFRHVGAFLAMTEFAREILVRDGVPAERVHVKPNMVEDPGATHMPVAERPPVALFAGRLVPEKGIETLLRAWQLAAPPGHQLHVCGDGPLQPLVRAAQERDPSIVLRGWVTREEMEAELGGARLALVPSQWYEAGPPLVLLDALAHGTPVLASDLANISGSLVEAEAGATFATGDPSSLAEALRRALTDLGLLTEYQRRGRALYERDHTPERALQNLERVYATVMSET